MLILQLQNAVKVTRATNTSMKDNLELSHQLTQTQTLAPVQLQYVKLLEMNTAAIEDEVARCIDENPALEVVPDSDTAVPTDGYGETAEQLQRADYRDEDDIPVYRIPRDPDRLTDRRTILETATADSEDMSHSLLRQLDERSDIDAATRAYAEYIIGNMDTNGRLTRTLAAIADDITFSTGHEVSATTLEPAFRAIRSLDPPGVGAVDLQDCLLLQLQRRAQDADVVLATEIVRDNFEFLAGRRNDRIAARTGATQDSLERALAIIQTLNPKPGNSDSSDTLADRTMHISPDFLVEPDYSDPTGRRFQISLTQRIPELTVAQWIQTDDEPENANIDRRQAEASAFVRSRVREAGEFIDLLGRRTATLMAVMSAIVQVQSDFFHTEDPATIRPMILKEIAAMTGRDISVISRATAGKYIATQGGIYPLKMFFNERPVENSDLSAHNILQTMRAIIDDEDKTNPLSDDALTEQLKAKGIDIARRTVAKYREQLNIPNSRGRRVIAPVPRPRRKK